MTDLARRLIAWYEENKRDLPWRRTNDPYRIWVSEIMLQQTRVEAVKPYYDRFLSALPDLKALAGADDERLHKLWQGLGYYRRVRHMKDAALVCVRQYGASLPADYDALRALPGVGDYTAGAVAAFAFGLPRPAIDGNVRRVVARYLGIETPVGDKAFEKEIEAFIDGQLPQKNAAAFDQALIELGATLCGPDGASRCGGCPLVAGCAAFRDGKTALLPVRAPKKERRIERRTVLVLRYDGKTALSRRPEKGLLSGLWELPSLDGSLDEQALRCALCARGARPERISPLPHARHIFTHVLWEMDAFLVEVSLPGDFDFYTREECLARAIPSAFKPFLPYL